jgi:hypothetical protein
MDRDTMTQEERDRRRGACLCYRCEHRALNLETGWQPRMECGSAEGSRYACYMFKPVRPIVLAQHDPKDKRPFMGPPLISSRACALRAVRDGELRLRAEDKEDGGMLVYWEIKRKRKKKGKVKNEKRK